MAFGYVYLAFVTALTILSVRTLVILKKEAPWTSAGWIFTILYDCGASDEVLTHTHLPLHAPYVALAALIFAFIIAGIRDEPQGDPWWWPSRLALTRAEQRIAKAPR